ncbi:helix-turn-helix domain-containing protein [Sporosarcina sp. ANT_H38]
MMAFEYLAVYATFKSVAEMDSNVKQHIDKYRLDLTANERAIVFAIAGRSLMYPGASHLKAETVCKAVGISRSTFMRAIKKLAAVGIIEKVNQTKLNGIMGANVYKILPFADTATPIQREAVEEASYDEVSEPIENDLSIKSFNLLKSIQANNIISVGDELALQAEKKKEHMNEWQVTLFDFMHSLPMKDELKDELHKVVLASEINDARDFVRAKDVLLNIIRDVNEGVLTISTTLRAVYKGAQSKVVERQSNTKVSTSTVEDNASNVRPVPFYNWLVERDDRPRYMSSKPTIENWLLW